LLTSGGIEENELALTQEEFDALLAWLDPDRDRDRAAHRYEEIRRRLIKIFVCRGCPIAEELTDETIDRVAHKAPEIAKTYVGDPALYFYGVANKIHLEYVRKKPAPAVVPAPDPPGEDDREYECLDSCMKQLKPEDQRVVLQYYEGEGQAKINHRKELADSLGVGLNTLRIRVYRLRAGLQQCVELCMQQAVPQ